MVLDNSTAIQLKTAKPQSFHRHFQESSGAPQAPHFVHHSRSSDPKAAWLELYAERRTPDQYLRLASPTPQDSTTPGNRNAWRRAAQQILHENKRILPALGSNCAPRKADTATLTGQATETPAQRTIQPRELDCTEAPPQPRPHPRPRPHTLAPDDVRRVRTVDLDALP